MSRRGFYTMARGYFDHPMFALEPFTEREAFQWMIETAAYEPCQVRVARATIALERGQLAFALRFLATKWQWSEPRVRRFLKRLESDAMVLVQATREATQITICNYDKHQLGRRTEDAQNDAPNVTTATHSRRKEEELKESKEVKKEKEDIRSVAIATRRLEQSPDDWPKDFREVFWLEYPRKVGKISAMKELDKVRLRKSVSFEKLISAVRAYTATADPQFTKHPERWLSKGCWDDKPDTRKPNGQSGNVVAAADRLLEDVRALSRPQELLQPGIRGGESAVDVRMLPQGRGE